MKQVMIGIGKGIEATLGKTKYIFLFNGYAMFALQEEFGADYISKITQGGKDGIAALYKTVEILSTQGELAREFAGAGKGTPLSEKELKTLVLPKDIAVLTECVMSAIAIGFGREIESEEVDLILLEQEKKRR